MAIVYVPYLAPRFVVRSGYSHTQYYLDRWTHLGRPEPSASTWFVPGTWLE